MTLAFGCDSKARGATTKNQRVRELYFIKFLEYYVLDILATESQGIREVGKK